MDRITLMRNAMDLAMALEGGDIRYTYQSQAIYDRFERCNFIHNIYRDEQLGGEVQTLQLAMRYMRYLNEEHQAYQTELILLLS